VLLGLSATESKIEWTPVLIFICHKEIIWAFCAFQMQITMLTGTRRIQPTTSHYMRISWSSIVILGLSSHLRRSVRSGLFARDFRTTISIYFSSILCVLYAPPILYSLIWQPKLKNRNDYTPHNALFSSLLLLSSLRCKYSPNCIILKHPQFMFFP
jgi:hypothetical protein